MSTRVTINIGFYFEKEHYAQLQGYLPRSEALNIPELKLQSTKIPHEEPPIPKPTKASAPIINNNNNNKKESDDENSEVEDDDNNIPNEMQIENEIENEEDNLMDQQQQKQMENALQMLDQQEPEESEEEDKYDSERIDDEEEEELDYESLSQSMKNFNNLKTKRQKGESKDLIQLPDRRPRKDKKLDEANQIIRRQEKERKRKQYLKKQIEAQEKATLDKILNETGRKLRMREEKQIEEQMEREQKTFKTLGDVPKIITLINEAGNTIMVHNTKLFSDQMTTSRDVKMKETCTKCGKQSKYKLKNLQQFACSLPCYKMLQV